MRTVISETAEAIGWHQHGSRWVWGVASNDGCDLCDAADRWLLKQISRELPLQSQLAIALKRRGAAHVESNEPAPVVSLKKLKQEERARRQRTMF